MGRSLRGTATTVGSVAVVTVVVLLVSSDAETAVALGGFCVLGYGSYAGYRRSDAARSVRSRLPPRAKQAVGVVVALAAVVAVADGAEEILWLTAICAFGYTGYRTGSVVRGGIYGAVAGVGSAAALCLVAGVVLLLAGVAGVAGARELLVKLLVAPPLVGFFTLLWGVFLVAVGAVVGLVSGALGGAVARLL